MKTICLTIECDERVPLISGSLLLKNVSIVRDEETLITFDSLSVTSSPYYVFRNIPTGFGKLSTQVGSRLNHYVGIYVEYLKDGLYLVQTPDGQKAIGYDALAEAWSSEDEAEAAFSNSDFEQRGYSIIHPIKLLKTDQKMKKTARKMKGFWYNISPIK